MSSSSKCFESKDSYPFEASVFEDVSRVERRMPATSHTKISCRESTWLPSLGPKDVSSEGKSRPPKPRVCLGFDTKAFAEKPVLFLPVSMALEAVEARAHFWSMEMMRKQFGSILASFRNLLRKLNGIQKVNVKPFTDILRAMSAQQLVKQ